ncbi:MAG: hypothetical protein HRU08_08325 [Oleispira sp.]|nr:hypothetical protein [Oleispira sp.]
MIVEEIILALLTTMAPAEISTKVSDRIDFGVVNSGTATPSLRVTGVSKPASERTSTGQQHTTKRSTYQIDVFSDKYLEATELASAIGDHLDGYQGTHENLVIQLIEVEGINPGFGNTTEQHQHLIELTILHRSK